MSRTLFTSPLHSGDGRPYDLEPEVLVFEVAELAPVPVEERCGEPGSVPPALEAQASEIERGRVPLRLGEVDRTYVSGVVHQPIVWSVVAVTPHFVGRRQVPEPAHALADERRF